jgi:hypothetical protein
MNPLFTVVLFLAAFMALFVWLKKRAGKDPKFPQGEPRIDKPDRDGR